MERDKNGIIHSFYEYERMISLSEDHHDKRGFLIRSKYDSIQNK